MRNMLIAFLVLSSQLLFGQSEKIERAGEPAIYEVASDDPELNEAVNKSRSTFNDFIKAFQNKESSQSGFSVKMPFATEYGFEHIWLTNLELKQGDLFGIVDNLPQSVTTVRLGDVVKIDASKITDWFYIENGKLVGGLTIRVLRDRMSAAEKKRFDRTFGIKLE